MLDELHMNVGIWDIFIAISRMEELGYYIRLLNILKEVSFMTTMLYILVCDKREECE